ncbi:hypothetical protein JW859_07655 [bacterium]|nr:hypothetical protein [bacterium]
MGTGFTIDTPLKVARYGIDSVVSLLDDHLIEQIREYHSAKAGDAYEPITTRAADYRARRISAYLDLLQVQVERQTEALRNSDFVAGSEITRYFELLPDGPLSQLYKSMLAEADPRLKADLQARLRRKVVSGSIDVNIMTKADSQAYQKGAMVPQEQSVAHSALRGYALSHLDNSAVVFSAGLNQRLYAYAAQFADFFPDQHGHLKKRIIIKVSDYRSALIQGKYLARLGLWVSEFRIESGLNCGGHAFSGRGSLMGIVLAEFKARRKELKERLLQECNKALAAEGRPVFNTEPALRITVQGGICTAREQDYLRKVWDVDSVGWGTPFLLVPEATNVDRDHLRKLVQASERDVFLSDSSPLGVPFWNLRQSASEQARRRRNQANNPGSACPKGFAKLSTEFSDEPLCPASRSYLRLKLAQLDETPMPNWRRRMLKDQALAKACICHDLAGGASLLYQLDPTATPAICCGPSIVNFNRVASLDEMVGHIYGRLSILGNQRYVNHMYREVQLYVQVLRRDVIRCARGLLGVRPTQLESERQSLISQIRQYREFYTELLDVRREKYLHDLEQAIRRLERIPLASAFRRWARRQASASKV